MKTLAAGLTLLLALVPSRTALPTHAPAMHVMVRDSIIAEAREAIANGRPWRATRLLAPVLRDSALRTSEAELVAAMAAAVLAAADNSAKADFNAGRVAA